MTGYNLPDGCTDADIDRYWGDGPDDDEDDHDPWWWDDDYDYDEDTDYDQPISI